jgi:hypothetical protein
MPDGKTGAFEQRTAPMKTKLNIISLALAVTALCLFGMPGKLFAADPLNTWHIRTSPYGTTNSLRAITYANGKFVTVGTRGKVAISTNGVDWFPYAANTVDDFFALAYGNGKFVGVGEGGMAFTSTDGMTWTPQDMDTSAHFYHLNYANGLFIAVGGGGAIRSSPDGVTWTPRNTGSTNQWGASAYGNGTYAVVGYRSSQITRSGASPNLQNWDVRDTGSIFYLSGVAFGDGKFVAVGYGGQVQTSTNGVNWSGVIDASNEWLYYVTCSNNTFMAVGEDIILSSTNGVDWTNRYYQNEVFHSVAYGNDTWVAVGNHSTIVQSDPPGAEPAAIVMSDPVRAGNQFSFKFNGEVGQSYNVQSTTNFINWSFVTNITCTMSPTTCARSVGNNARVFFRVVKQ